MTNPAWLKGRGDLAANVVIALSVLAIGVHFFKPELLRLPSTEPSVIQAGQRFALPPSQIPAADQTLVVVLQQGCGYCAASMPFYRKLAQAVEGSPRRHLTAILPQDIATGKRYLASNNVPIADVRQAALRSIDTPYTPTLLLLDRNSTVQRVWIGQLSPESEQQVLQTLTQKP